jgi:hypothetical protein
MNEAFTTDAVAYHGQVSTWGHANAILVKRCPTSGAASYLCLIQVLISYTGTLIGHIVVSISPLPDYMSIQYTPENKRLTQHLSINTKLPSQWILLPVLRQSSQ